MPRVLIIGYGNALRSDDGLGWQIAVEMFRNNRTAEVEVLPCHQLTPELADVVSRVETVLFVDCARTGVPGEFHCEELRTLGPSPAFTHDLTPAGLLAISSELFGACPRGFLLSIGGKSFQPGDVLSEEVRRTLPALKAAVRRLTEDALALTLSAR